MLRDILVKSMDFISIPISIFSLAISIGTFWLVFIKRGSLKMTKPTVVFLGYDHTPNPTAKIFIRTLLYSTAHRGVVIEGMFAKIHSKNQSDVFYVWGYGEQEKLVQGSGLYVSQSGVSANHHFVSSVLAEPFQFDADKYTIEVFAREANQHKAKRLEVIELKLSSELKEGLGRYEGVLFERTIDRQYIGHCRPHSSKDKIQ